MVAEIWINRIRRPLAMATVDFCIVLLLFVFWLFVFCCCLLCVFFIAVVFIPRHFKMCGVLCYTLRLKNLRLSVHPFVRPSVRPSALRFRSLWPKWFKFLLRYEFTIPNSEFWIPNSEFRIPDSEFRIPNSEFWIPNSEFRISKKKVVYGNFVFGDATSGSVHGVWQGNQNRINSSNIIA